MQAGNFDLEALAVTTILDNGEVSEYGSRIKSEWLIDATVKLAWENAVAYYHDYRETIPWEVLRQRVPAFRRQHGDVEDVDGILDSLQDRWLTQRVQMLYEEEVTGMEDPKLAIPKILSNLAGLQASIQRETGSDIADTIDDSWARYKYRKDHYGTLGLPWPWPPLQANTNGAQDGSYNLIYARPKHQKTFVMLEILHHWMKYCGRRILFVTREMTKEQIQDRLLCLWARVAYKRFLQGQMTAEEEKRVCVARDEIKKKGNFYVETVEGYGSTAGMEISALTEQYGLEDGDVVAVDGLYFYAQDQDWRSCRAFSQSLKQLALGSKAAKSAKKLVLIVTSQGNQNFSSDENADAGREMALGDGPIQDCDLALKLNFRRDEKAIDIVVSASRESEGCTFTINAIPCEDYSLKYSKDYDGSSEDVSTIPAPHVGRKRGGKKRKRAYDGEKTTRRATTVTNIRSRKRAGGNTSSPDKQRDGARTRKRAA